MRCVVAALAALCATAGTAWACSARIEPTGAALLITLLPSAIFVFSIAAVCALVATSNRPLPETAIHPAGVEALARRARRFWLFAIALLCALPVLFNPMLTGVYVLAVFGPVAFAIQAHVAVRRARRADVHVLADDHHVVLYGPGNARIWLRATPQRIAVCAIPRAIVR